MSIEIAILLKRVLSICYCNVAEIRILYNTTENNYSMELKKVGQTLYFEDEEAVLLHLEEVLVT